MREIKFRGKRVDNGEWVYGYYWAEEHRNQNAHHIYTKETKGETDLIRITGNFIVIQETVGQYTGLKDNNGVEIYEGDYIYKKSWHWGKCFVFLATGQVGPCVGENVMEWRLGQNVNNPNDRAIHNLWDGKDVEVVGNIHEEA